MKKIHLVLTILLFFLSAISEDSYAQVKIVEAYPSLPYNAFNNPLDFQHADDGTNMVYVVERGGVIKKFENKPSLINSEVDTLLDISPRIVEKFEESKYGEGGLLGLAFHPNFSTNGYFYVFYTYDDAGQFTAVISRFETDGSNPSKVDINTELKILKVPQVEDNHNGGQLQFGPDGFLYIALGEDDGGGKSQDRSVLPGSLIRIDIDNTQDGLNYAIPGDNPFVGEEGVREEIFAYGLRNLWRFSFDSETGKIWGADVGGKLFEEINIIKSGKNYGWGNWEGDYQKSTTHLTCDDALTKGSDGSVEYHVYGDDWCTDENIGQRRSITGGFVYRGEKLKDLQGRYVFGDFIIPKVWSLGWDGNTITDKKEIRVDENVPEDSFRMIASFGKDKEGELYIISYAGRIFKLVPDEVSEVTVQGTFGKDGWRFMGTAKTDETYEDLLTNNNIWTQGATAGGNTASGYPNVWTWNEAQQQYNSITDLKQTIPNGKGFSVYIFEDDDPGTSGIQRGWPKTITSKGTEQTGKIDFLIEYTEGVDENIRGFNLLANPYPYSIDWSSTTGWTKNQILDGIYIWDPNENSGFGNYKQWLEGSGDDITLISPYQAFFVQASGAGASLSATEEVQRSGGTFLKSTEQPLASLTFKIETEGFEDNAYFAFRDEAVIARDGQDALKLDPLSEQYLQLYSVTTDDISLAINSLPAEVTQKMEIPISIATTLSGDAELTWEKTNIPAEWTFTLNDSHTGSAFNLDQQDRYRFSVVGTQTKNKDKGDGEPSMTGKLRMLKSDTAPRFKLTIDSNRDQTETPAEIPSSIVLDQNYPNPFNPSTIIRFGLPNTSFATLKVYNILGQEVRTLVNREMEAGFHEVNFNAAGLSSGTYIYQITAGGFIQSKKMLIMK